jgi:hypothetical protein
MRAEARPSHWRVSRRILLARRTDERFEPHVRIHRRAREEDRALDSHDAIALLSFTGPRQGGDRRTAVSQFWRQTLDGPSDGLAGSMVRARSLGAHAGLIETRSPHPLSTATSLIPRLGRRAPYPTVIASRGAPTRIWETEFCGQRLSTAHAADKPQRRWNEFGRPTSTATSRGNVVLFCGLGNHADLRGLLGGAEGIRTSDLSSQAPTASRFSLYGFMRQSDKEKWLERAPRLSRTVG